MPRFQSTLEWWKVFQFKAELDLFLLVCAVFHVLPPLFRQSGPAASSSNSRCWSLSTTLGNLPFSSPYFTNLNLLFFQLPFSPSPTLSVNNWTSHKFWAAAWLAGRIQEGKLPLAGAAFCRVLRLPDVCPAVGRQNSGLQSAFFFFFLTQLSRQGDVRPNIYYWKISIKSQVEPKLRWGQCFLTTYWWKVSLSTQ